MNFKYSCIGDNTPENREWLEKVGYKLSMQEGSELDNEILTAYKNEFYDSYSKFMVDYFLYKKEHINCIGNPQLFRAVTAMREDTSNNQWWVFNEDFDKYKKGDFVMGGFHRCSCYCHVATLEELINHFSMDVCPDNNPMKVFRKKA